jgi:hypothetical protein
MQILHPEREAAKLIVTGTVITIVSIYGIRTGTVGDYLQKFAWFGRRRYTRHPQRADRRMYQVIGGIGVLIGVAAIGFGTYTLVTR